MPGKTTTFKSTGLVNGEVWSNPANWDDGVPIDGDTVVLSAGFTNGGADDIATLSLAVLTEQSRHDLTVIGSRLTIGTLVGAAYLTAVTADAADAHAPVVVTIGNVTTPSLNVDATGAGAVIADQAATDLGEYVSVDQGGKIVLSAAPASTSSFDYLQDGGTFAFETLGGATTSVFQTVGPGDVLEVPGGVVSNVMIGPTSLRVVTDKDSYAFTHFGYVGGLRGYSASFDQSTGLVAITFGTIDQFQPTVAAAGATADIVWRQCGVSWTAGLAACLWTGRRHRR